MTFFLVVLALAVLAMAFCVYMLIRNNWVANTRISWIKERRECSISYDRMLNRFWDWSTDVDHWETIYCRTGR